MNTLNCTKECRFYKTKVIPTGPGGQADLGVYCGGETLVTQAMYRRGRITNRFDADYRLKEKAEQTPCISPDQRTLI